MKPTFHHRLLNTPFEDPCLYIRVLREKRAFLFDIGHIARLSVAEILKVTDIFITHTHIDHFIGFDAVLRTLLGREQPLNVFGPSNIIDCIEGKLKGYTWNLIREYPLKIEVFGISDALIGHASFYAEDCFRRIQRDSKPFRGITFEEAGFNVKTVSLNHDIQCLGFSLEEDFHINIDKVKLSSMGLPVGPWLADLKRAIRQGLPEDKEFSVNGKRYTLRELRKIAMITEGQKVSYIVDASPDEENIKKILKLVKGSDTLYIEAYFLDADIGRAVKRNHLTAGIAGKIAKQGCVRNLIVTHFSPKYRQTPFAPTEEAMKEFKG